MSDAPKKIYILSTGRSGSTLLYSLFKELYPELEITHQTFGSRIINVISNIPLISNTIKVSLLRLLFLLFKGNKYPHSTVDPLLSLAILHFLRKENIDDKNYKIIHLTRDPRTFVTSFMNWKFSSWKRIILHHLIPFWQPSPYFDKELPLSESIKFDKVKQFIYVWHYKNNLIYNTFSNYNNYKLIRLEDITESKDYQRNIKDLLEFLELPEKNFDFEFLSKVKVNKSIKNNYPRYKNWSEEHQNYLKNTCSNLMNIFGYKINN